MITDVVESRPQMHCGCDEVVGVLALKLGAASFKHKIKILNPSEAQMALMKHVIARRLATQTKRS